MNTAILAFLFDCIIGDPNTKFHPVALIGRLISALEHFLYRPQDSDARKFASGAILVLLVLLISVILFFFIRTDNLMMRLFIRILLIPVIAGISYEIIRLAGRESGGIIDLISLPGLWMQRLTTKEPDDDMIEVAIASVEAVFNWRQYLMDEFGMTEDQIAEETAG